MMQQRQFYQTNFQDQQSPLSMHQNQNPALTHRGYHPHFLAPENVHQKLEDLGKLIMLFKSFLVH